MCAFHKFTVLYKELLVNRGVRIKKKQRPASCWVLGAAGAVHVPCMLLQGVC